MVTRRRTLGSNRKLCNYFAAIIAICFLLVMNQFIGVNMQYYVLSRYTRNKTVVKVVEVVEEVVESKDQYDNQGNTTNRPKVADASTTSSKININAKVCPLVFGLGHQKSGTSTIVKALGSIANLTALNDVRGFWLERKLSDVNFLRVIHRRSGMIQKEGHGIQYTEQMTRLCPNMRYYVVRRETLSIVRSVADRLQITDKTQCKTINRFPPGWRPILDKSNDKSCLIRIAASVLDYERRIESFKTSHPSVRVEEVQYEDYLEDRFLSMQSLCTRLEVLGSCNATKQVDSAQYQGKGKNSGKAFEDIWPADVLDRLRAMVNTTSTA